MRKVKSKRLKKIYESVDVSRTYTLSEAIELLINCPKVKFNESVEVSIKTGVDTKKSDQQVRGTVALPNGTGKTIKVVVLAKGDNIEKAKAAGADQVGSQDLIDQIKGGWTDFDVLVATPDMMREVGKLGKILGPRGLMPTPKGGTVTTDVEKAVQELKAGKVEFKADKGGVINNLVGKSNFEKERLEENIVTLLGAIQRAKPATAKGVYLKSMYLSTTMGPGLKIDITSAA